MSNMSSNFKETTIEFTFNPRQGARNSGAQGKLEKRVSGCTSNFASGVIYELVMNGFVEVSRTFEDEENYFSKVTMVWELKDE